ncbi:unnamed protein product [Durusdinium trenchii]|uniref:Uncharacterized protein n=2 Tax=Durusdinium trenchii TaxID=1381693 RepID=A0ABP0HNJ2_9DINO
MVSQLNRRLFRALQPVEIVSWHQLGATTHRTFLRELTDRLLLGEGVGGEHRFDRDRVYWFSRPEVPGSFEAGVITASQRKFDARVILGLFLPGAEEPVLLYAADRLSLDC